MSDIPQIFAFGNSHVSIFTGQNPICPIWPDRSNDKLPWFKTFRIGPVTAYQAVKHMKTIYSIMREVGFDKNKDTILFVFGEVDIRAHIIEQTLKQNKYVNHITKEVVDRYWSAIMNARDKGYRVAVFGCIAGFKLKPGAQQPAWPHVGTCKERNEITRDFNNDLSNRCFWNGVPFVSVFDEMLLLNGETDIRYLDEGSAGCHATTKLLPLILWKFRNVGLIPFDTKLCEWES